MANVAPRVIKRIIVVREPYIKKCAGCNKHYYPKNGHIC